MKFLKDVCMLVVVTLAVLMLTPIVRFDAWLERRERERVARRKFNSSL